MRRQFITFLLVAVTAGCSGQKKAGQNTSKLPTAAKSILEKADQIELISINPGERGQFEYPKGEYYGWKVLGRTTIEDADTRKSIISAAERGIAEEGRPAKCFDPRHAIHATSYDGENVDILICFHCSQVEVYVNGKDEGPFLGTSSFPEPVFDKVLTKANVPLAPKPPKR